MQYAGGNIYKNSLIKITFYTWRILYVRDQAVQGLGWIQNSMFIYKTSILLKKNVRRKPAILYWTVHSLDFLSVVLDYLMEQFM